MKAYQIWGLDLIFCILSTLFFFDINEFYSGICLGMAIFCLLIFIATLFFNGEQDE